MDEEPGVPTPLSPDERRRAELIQIHQEEKRRLFEEAARIKVENGAEIAQRLDIKLIDDENVRKIAADEMAKLLAEGGARRGPIDWREHWEVPDKAIERAFAAEELNRQREKELDAERARAAEEQRQREEEKRAREVKEREERKLAARNEPVRGAVERLNAMFKDDKTQEREASPPQPSTPENQRSWAQREQLNLEYSQVRGEVTDAKAARLARLFDRSTPERGVDPDNHTRSHERGPRDRGGRDDM